MQGRDAVTTLVSGSTSATSVRCSTPPLLAKPLQHPSSLAAPPPPRRLSTLPGGSPVHPDRLDLLLDGFHERDYLVQGFTLGFKTHFEGSPESFESRNSLSTNEHPEAVDHKIDEELRLGRIAGPFTDPPFAQFKCCPLALREKSTPGSYRLLHNLSYPYDDRSVNLSITQEHKTVKYATLSDAVHQIQELGPGCYLAKSDIKNTFRIVPLHPSQYTLMGFKWRDRYYYDMCLAMGLAESCRVFETFSDAILFILDKHFGVKLVVKVLDDFLFLGRTKSDCASSLRIFLRLCNYLGVPIAMDKTSEEPAQVLTFLGIELNTLDMTASLPMDKLQAYSREVGRVSQENRANMTVRELRSLVGKLQFAMCVIPCGRAFLRRLIDLYAPVHKPYWHVRLNSGHRQDLSMWAAFLAGYNGVTIIRQPAVCDSHDMAIKQLRNSTQSSS